MFLFFEYFGLSRARDSRHYDFDDEIRYTWVLQ